MHMLLHPRSLWHVYMQTDRTNFDPECPSTQLLQLAEVYDKFYTTILCLSDLSTCLSFCKFFRHDPRLCLVSLGPSFLRPESISWSPSFSKLRIFLSEFHGNPQPKLGAYTCTDAEAILCHVHFCRPGTGPAHMTATAWAPAMHKLASVPVRQVVKPSHPIHLRQFCLWKQTKFWPLGIQR